MVILNGEVMAEGDIRMGKDNINSFNGGPLYQVGRFFLLEFGFGFGFGFGLEVAYTCTSTVWDGSSATFSPSHADIGI